MDWISVKDRLPEDENKMNLLYHTVFGIGFGWIYTLEPEIMEEDEESLNDKYICTVHFVKNKLDGNYCIDDEEGIDVYERSPHFWNLGTVTRWMPLPEPPKELHARPKP